MRYPINVVNQEHEPRDIDCIDDATTTSADNFNNYFKTRASELLQDYIQQNIDELVLTIQDQHKQAHEDIQRRVKDKMETDAPVFAKYKTALTSDQLKTLIYKQFQGIEFHNFYAEDL